MVASIDGVARESPGLAGCGYIFINNDMQFLGAFAYNIGINVPNL